MKAAVPQLFTRVIMSYKCQKRQNLWHNAATVYLHSDKNRENSFIEALFACPTAFTAG